MVKMVKEFHLWVSGLSDKQILDTGKKCVPTGIVVQKFSKFSRMFLRQLCTTFLVKPRSKTDSKVILTLSFWILVETGNRFSRDLLFWTPGKMYLVKNSEILTVASWLSWIQLSCWTFLPNVFLSWSKNLNGQISTTRQKRQ